MDALVSFHFVYEGSDLYPDARSFVMKFDVTPDARLAAIIRHEDDGFDQRLDELMDDLDIDYPEEWPSFDADLFGWLTNNHELHGDPLEEVRRVRDFLLDEGFRGGEIVEIPYKQFLAMAAHTHTQADLEAVLNAL
ncbi:hypothetical protein [Pseudomonas serbica]|jgi:hypothetical protein|uniref:hypothetical protein n=1 Tax=Pseudomonas serbica TaxID=2965074 RepID=UPI00237C4C7F|nr:hypothetical protein [Pseudomonas serbica]